MKRIISILLAFILGLSLLPVSAFATESDKRAEEYEEATRYFVANYNNDFGEVDEYLERSNEVITKSYGERSQPPAHLSQWYYAAPPFYSQREPPQTHIRRCISSCPQRF